MDEILKKIEADELSILSSRSSDSLTLVSSNSRQYSIVPASHETSANLLKRVYRKTIHNIKLKARLNTIGEVVHRRDDYIPPDFFQDLLEVQRVGFFSESVRSQAWDLLLILLERRRTEAIIDVISRWPPLEARLFLHQLTLYRFTKWTLHPLRLTPVRNQTKEDITPSITGPANASVVIAGREDALAFSYRNIIATLLKTNAPIVHEALSLDGYLDLQLPTISANLDDIASDDVLFRFFGYLFQHYEDTDNNGKQLAELPLLGRDLVHYASSGSPDCIERIVDYIVTSISTPTSKEADSLPQHVRVLLHERGQLGLPSNIHPVAPFLWFTIHLAIHSKTAFQLLMEEDLLQILKKIWATADDDPRGYSQGQPPRMVPRAFTRFCCKLRHNQVNMFIDCMPGGRSRRTS
ncbi:hypothetical protein K474DRAFT_1123115 [Panus rudis PR-1116 ss-1]|nr:hypothetical protein K474DRAFT_1123115 [Panus rudis PR-1116 ss-1]